MQPAQGELIILGTERFLVRSGKHNQFWRSAGSWETLTIWAISSTLKRTRGTYIDIGAWIGPTVLPAARLADHVIAYEPDPVAGEELRANIALNGLSNVEIRQVALLDHDGQMPFGPGRGSAMGASTSTLMFGDRSLLVGTRDAAVEFDSPEFSKCSLLKIDVEGAEYVLVPRLRRYLENAGPTLLLSTHGPRYAGAQKDREGPIAAVAGIANYLLQRARSFDSLRAYKHFYVVSGKRPRPKRWRSVSRLGRAAELLKFGNREYMLSRDPVALP